ncbi:hypothetical protein NITGR_1050002 [Nitrospina gracilis 3/211]|uniref:SHOCT domain-containing protein n=1 Tax=Nitrospina gracilis (strain 3/211) TaxID=1266370 RepID=M1Z8Q4_NITG3|nr:MULTISPECIES: SHOCT domain-containing protein [Nitrospina]MCF8722240.1 hypothetical protein [Nitrospina sp. Nb-3]CCQ89439.1 hypothetical protein NITGR_1050002 [Nitrospina gracilis 3/211]
MSPSKHTQLNPNRFCRWTALFLLVCLIAMLAGCKIKHEPESSGRVLEVDDLTLRYISKFQLGDAVAQLQLQHPLEISEEALVQQMWSLKYKPNSLLGEEGRVFTKEDVMNSKRLLTKALNRARSGNAVGFTIESEDGDTEGAVFASDNRLYWKFDKIQGVAHNLTRNFNARYGSSWHMLPQEGQKYFVTGKLFGNKTWENWIVADLDYKGPVKIRRLKRKTGTTVPEKQNPKQMAPENTQPQATGNEPPLNPELVKKLEFLKSLHDRKLIGEEEYLEKRKELLDSLF